MIRTRNKFFFWLGGGIIALAAISIPLGVVFGLNKTPDDMVVDKEKDSDYTATITYGQGLDQAQFVDEAYPAAEYEAPVFVFGSSAYAPGATAGSTFSVKVRYQSKNTSKASVIVTYKLTVLKAANPLAEPIRLAYNGYIYGTALAYDPKTALAVYVPGVNVPEGYLFSQINTLLVTGGPGAPYLASTPDAEYDSATTFSTYAQANDYLSQQTVEIGVPKLFLVFRAPLDTNNYEGEETDYVKIIVGITVNAAVAGTHETETREYADRFTWGDVSFPVDTVPTYTGYVRSAPVMTRDSPNGAVIVTDDLQNLPAGTTFYVRYNFTVDPNFAGGSPFSVTNAFTVNKKAVSANNVAVAVNLTYGGLLNGALVTSADLKQPTAADAPSGYEQFGSQAPNYVVARTSAVGDPEASASFPHATGDSYAADDASFVGHLKSMPYQTVVTRTYSLKPDANHAGADFTYTITYSVNAQWIAAGSPVVVQKNVTVGNALDVLAYPDVPNQVVGFTYSAVAYRIVKAPDAQSTPAAGDTVTAQQAAQLRVGYVVAQIYSASLANNNYRLNANGDKPSYEIQWTIVADQVNNYNFVADVQNPVYGTAPANTAYGKPNVPDGYQDWGAPVIKVTKAASGNNADAAYAPNAILTADQLANAPAGTEYSVVYTAKPDQNHVGNDATHTYPFTVLPKQVAATQAVGVRANLTAGSSVAENPDAVPKVDGFTYGGTIAYVVDLVAQGATDYTVGQSLTKAQAEALKPGYAFRQVYLAALTNGNYVLAGTGAQTHTYFFDITAATAAPYDETNPTVGGPAYGVAPPASAYAKPVKLDGYNDWNATPTITVAQGVAATADNYQAAFATGATVSAAQLASAPAGTEYAVVYAAAPDAYHTGTNAKYTYRFAVKPKPVTASPVREASVDLTAGSSVREDPSGVPAVEGFTYGSNITYFVDAVPQGATDYTVNQSVTKAQAEGLKPGYRFRQVYTAALTSANYALSGTALQTHTYLFTVTAAAATGYDETNPTVGAPTYGQAPLPASYGKPAKVAGYNDWNATPTITVTKGVAATADNYLANFATNAVVSGSQLGSAPAGTEYSVVYTAAPDEFHAGANAKYTYKFVVKAKPVTAVPATGQSTSLVWGATVAENVAAVPTVEGFTYGSTVTYFVDAVPQGATDYTVNQSVTKAQAEGLKPSYRFRQVYTAALTNANYVANDATVQTYTNRFTIEAAPATATNEVSPVRTPVFGTAPLADTYLKPVKVANYDDWGAPSFVVTKGVAAGANNFNAAFEQGDAFTEAQLANAPAGTEYEVRYVAKPDAYHTGADSTYAFRYAVAKKQIGGQDVSQAIDPTDLTTARVVTGSAAITPLPVTGITFGAEFVHDDAVAVFYKITNVPAGTPVAGEPVLGERIADDAAGRARLAGLRGGFRFAQTFTAKLSPTLTDSDNYQLAGGQTYHYEWVVDPKPIALAYNIYEGDTNFASIIAKTGDISRAPGTGYTPWEQTALFVTNGAAVSNLDINDAAALNRILTTARTAGARVVTQRFQARPTGGRDVVQRYVLTYTVRVDTSHWSLEVMPYTGSQNNPPNSSSYYFQAATNVFGSSVQRDYAFADYEGGSYNGIIAQMNATVAKEFFTPVAESQRRSNNFRVNIKFKIDNFTVKSLQVNGFSAPQTPNVGIGTDSSLTLLSYGSGATITRSNPGPEGINTSGSVTGWSLTGTALTKVGIRPASLLRDLS